MPDAKPIVLVVDDTPANLELLHGILRDEYQVKVATNGQKALELANKSPRPDIILLDIMMPEMSGYEVCQMLKENTETMPIPVIFVTAKSHLEDEEQGLAFGAVDYITKPFHPEIVKARVQTHLANYEQRRDLIKENRELRDAHAPSFTNFNEESLLGLIEAGEGQTVEFKSALRWNSYSGQVDKKIENSCLKTVAGYINAEGGILMVGVNDSGEPVGLDNDQFKSEDKLLLHWVNLLKSYLGTEFTPYIRSIIHSIGNKRILVVECLPSSIPVFFTRDNEEFFFVRMTNTTQALKPSEVVVYIEQHRNKVGGN